MATAASQAARRKGSASKKVVPDEAAPGSLFCRAVPEAEHCRAYELRRRGSEQLANVKAMCF